MIKILSKHKEEFNRQKVKLITAISFLMGFSGALLSYIISFYFKLATGTDNVGVYFLLSFIVFLVALLNLHKLVKWMGKSGVFYTVFTLRIITTIFLIFLPPSIWGVIFLILFVVFEGLSWVNLDIILESFSTDRMSGRIRGIFLTIMNTGLLLGPFVSTNILENFNFKGVFFSSLIIQFLIFSIILMGLRGVNHRFNKEETIRELLKKVWKRKNVLRSYYISFVLDFFYAIMVIYTPLYLLHRGFSWGEIGIIFSIMLIPFIIIQYPAGRLADKKTGEKELLIISIFIMGIATLYFYVEDSPNLYVWATILFATRVGASLLEIMRDSYFYKRIDAGDVDLINFFRTSKPIAYIMATGIASIVLLFFPLDLIFLLLVIVVFSALYPAFRLVDNKSELEIKIGEKIIKKSF